MNDLQVFNNTEFGDIRTVTINNEPWFVGKDVTGILGYTNASKALADHVDDEDKLNNESLSSLGQRGGWLVNESGLYSLILSSKMPNARQFKHWVTSEVLPSIHRTGTYSTKSAAKKSPEELTAISQRAQATLINATQRTADLLTSIWDKAGIKPEYQVLALNDVCANIGIRLPRNALQNVKQTYDKTTIAKMVGIYSKASGGKVPHAQAVGAIIDQLGISEDEREKLPYYRNGHNGEDYEYTDSVVKKVKSWIHEHGYPVPLSLNGKNYNVVYDEAACPA